MVASQSRLASEVGADVLRTGGNAVDAAIATSFALGAVEPWMSGIGGGGYMVIRRPGDVCPNVVEFGMRAPRGLDVGDYPIVDGKANDLFPWPSVRDDANIFGARAVAIPGQVAGMALAHKTFGSKPWAGLLGGAIEAARSGLTVDWYCQLMLASAANDLSKFPASRAAFLDENGFPKSSAWTALNQNHCDLSGLATTLETIARDGAAAFYCGPLAEAIVSDLRAEGGRHCAADFETYAATMRDADVCHYRGHKVFGTPDFTAGPTLKRVLELLGPWQSQGTVPDAKAYAAYDSALRQASCERLNSMGDRAHEPAPSCTTHFNVVDANGTMVSVTQTLLSVFGSRLMLPETGILLNNGIMWFDPEPGKPNSIGPDKRCLSNMCPTLIEKTDGTRISLGAAGGRKILPAVAQLVSLMTDYDMDLEQAFHAPRIDTSLADVTIVDAAMEEHTQQELAEVVESLIQAPRTVFPYNFACPSAVSRQNGLNVGATEIASPWSDVAIG